MKELFPGLDSGDTAEELVLFFNTISQEFKALEPEDIPISYSQTIPKLEHYQVDSKIKNFKKPIPWSPQTSSPPF